MGDDPINEQMVHEGHAWAFRRYLKRTDSDYCYYQAEARAAKQGLWALPNERRIAPWAYRQRKGLTSFTDYSTETAAHCIAMLAAR